VLQCVAVCCSVSQCVAVQKSEVNQDRIGHGGGIDTCLRSTLIVVCCSVLQCVLLCCSVLQCVAMCCSVMQCVAVCCSTEERGESRSRETWRRD